MAADRNRPGAQARSWRILLAEDEMLQARDTEGMLRDMGCSVVGIAGTAESAVELARTHHPDLVFMDIRLKGDRDGIEAASQIRDCYGCRLVFVTAQSDEAILIRARATHPAGFLFKPFGEDELLDLLLEMGRTASF